MSEWFEDDWLGFGYKMAEEFFDFHYDKIPEEPTDVWVPNEIEYFCMAFVSWSSYLKFGREKEFDRRREEYLFNLKTGFEKPYEFEVGPDEVSNFKDFHKRETEYMRLFEKGSGSLIRAISGSIYKPACNAFIDISCKRYVFSKKNLSSMICPWLLDKGIEFDRGVNFN